MYIHIGVQTSRRGEEIIGFFDIDGQCDSKVTNDFLKRYEKSGRIARKGKKLKLPRSFVLTDDKIYFTPLSTTALKSRATHKKAF